MPMGVSAPVGEFVIDVRTVTLKELRPMLMYDIRGAMKRRSMLWQEVLFIFGRLPNIYDRPKSEMNKYQFGFVRKSKLEDVKLIHPSRETVPIAELIGATDFFSHDLVIVPVTQLHPDIENAPPPPSVGSSKPLLETKAPVSSGEFSRPGTADKNPPRVPSANGGRRAGSPPKPGSSGGSRTTASLGATRAKSPKGR